MCAQCQQDAITTTSTAYPVYKQPPLTLDGIGNLRLHDVKPKMGDALSHRLQALVQLSAVSSDLPRTVPRSYTTAVSSTTAGQCLLLLSQTRVCKSCGKRSRAGFESGT